jgi:SAM-dependent methyltransferase
MISGPSCPVCTDDGGRLFLTREQVPATQNLLLREAFDAVKVERGTLRLHYCAACGFVWNPAVALNLIRYDRDYENTQTWSLAFENHVRNLADHLVHERDVRACRIVEVGCGKGAFLRQLVEMSPGNSGIGYDPSYSGPLVDLDGRLRFERRFYGASPIEEPADVVVCRHVIEHVPDPVALLRLIWKALGNSANPRVFFETPCVEWILRRQVAWDFFHEHCSYFTASSLTTAFEAAGFQVDLVRHVFGGQYLWLEARPAAPSRPSRDPGDVPRLAQRFAAVEQARINSWGEAVRRIAGQGPAALWGAGAKGVTFANLLDPRRRFFHCVIDINPKKQGCYLPGTGHPVMEPEAVDRLGIKNILLMNSNYRTEIVQKLSDQCSAATLVDLLEANAA